jgi:hypothetical protein
MVLGWSWDIQGSKHGSVQGIMGILNIATILLHYETNGHYSLPQILVPNESPYKVFVS